MEPVQVSVGQKLIAQDGSTWRVLHIQSLVCTIIRIDTSKRTIVQMPLDRLVDFMYSNELTKAEENEFLVVDPELLTPEIKADFEKKKAFVNDVQQLFGPSYSAFTSHRPKKEFIRLYEQYGFSKVLANRIVRKWLQSGMQDASLLPPPAVRSGYVCTVKPGPKTKPGIIVSDEVKMHFEYGISLYKNSRLMTKEEAYARMISEYYSVTDGTSITPLPPDKRPSYRQFYYYISKKIDYETNCIIKTSKAEYRNNQRLLLGSPQDDALHPGSILEADALEADINIVSSTDSQKTIGRPIIYMLVDEYSHAIVAVSVALENNSMIGLSNLMLNLIDDKDVLLKNLGIDADTAMWPSCFIPTEIRCDRGSDFASDQFEKVCQELNIIRTLEPGATGSMKGLIEQSFLRFHQLIKPEFEKLGIMQNRYDSKHKIEACLTMESMWRLVVLFVFYHNAYYSKTRRLSKDMIAKGTVKSAISIWNYGVTRNGNPKPVTSVNYPQLLYKLMPPEKALITRKGVCFKGLYYTTKDDMDLLGRMKLATSNAGKRDKTGEKYNSMDIRFDPRSINTLYYLKDGSLQILNLLSSAQSKIKDMTWSEYEEYRKIEKDMDKAGEQLNLVNKVQRLNIMDMISKASISENYADPSDMRQSRKKEKNMTNFNNRISSRLRKENAEAVTEAVVLQEETPAVPDKKKPSGWNTESGNKDSEVMKNEENKAQGDDEGTIFSSTCPEDLRRFRR